MRKEIADLVLPVFRKAIEIKEGLRANERAWEFGESHKRLLALLQSPVPESVRADLLGDQRFLEGSALTSRLTGFLGVRYALACWLDEIFISDSPWKDQWNANKMETTLYGINERASRFWEQAQRAQTRPTRDALEVFYLCVMLGFRGDNFDKATEINAWREGAEVQITQGEDREYSPPPGLTITPNVRRLRGADVMHRWFMIVTAIGLVFIPVLFLLISRWLG